MEAENIDGKSILEALTANVLKTQFEDIDQATIDNTKYRVLDMIGCAIGGASLPDIEAVVEMVKEWGGKKEATILGHGIRGPVHDVAFVNCLMGRSFDRGPLAFRAGNRSWATHNSETTVLTALALGESKGINGKDLITALVIGDDLAARVQGAAGKSAAGGGLPGQNAQGPGQGPPGREFEFGFDPWATVTTFGAAAIAGRLLGLNSFQMKNAFGIAVSMISGAGSGLWDGATTFKLSQGSSARGGIIAAKLAKAGWTGIEDPFGTGNSYYPIFEKGLELPEMLTKDLGKKFYVEVVFKLNPGGGPTQQTTPCALILARKYDIKAEDIEEVILRTSPASTAAHYAKPYKVGGYPTADALFSYKYSVANALLRKTAQNKDYTEESVRDPEVQAIIRKVKLAGLSKPEGVEVEVKMKDGRTFTEYYTRRMESDKPGSLPSRDVLLDKFMEQVEFTRMVNKEDAEEIIRLVDGLEEVDNVAEIVKLAVRRNEHT